MSFERKKDKTAKATNHLPILTNNQLLTFFKVANEFFAFLTKKSVFLRSLLLVGGGGGVVLGGEGE